MKALETVYPTMKLQFEDNQSFPSKAYPEYVILTCLLGGHWAVDANRRDFFNNFASEHRFDPLIAENWYSVPRSLFTHTKVTTKLIIFEEIHRIYIAGSTCNPQVLQL